MYNVIFTLANINVLINNNKKFVVYKCNIHNLYYVNSSFETSIMLVLLSLQVALCQLYFKWLVQMCILETRIYNAD